MRFVAAILLVANAAFPAVKMVSLRTVPAEALLKGARATQQFLAAYVAGNADRARALYPYARSHYEAIEPVAEAASS